MRKVCYLVLLSVFMVTAGYACTGITKTVNEKTLYGANMDWNNPYAHIRFIPGEKEEFGIAILSHGEHNYSQGVNEAGLAIDHFMVPYNKITKNRDKEYYDGDLLIGVLKNCSTVDEALAMFNEYNLLILLSEFQLLITDKNGDSVIFEGDTIHRKKNDYQIATNVLHSKIKKSNNLCSRYKLAEEILGDSTLEVKVFEEILNKAKFNMSSRSTTIYSYIYNLNSGDIQLYSMGDFSKSLLLNIHEELKKGDHSIDFKKLLPNESQERYLARYIDSRPEEKFLTEKELKSYVGSYSHCEDEKNEIYLKDGYLYFSFYSNNFEYAYKMIPEGSEKFYFEKQNSRLTFYKKNGNVKGYMYRDDYSDCEGKKLFSFKHLLTNLFK